MRFVLSLLAFICLFQFDSFAQNESNAPVIYENNFAGALRSLRQGTFSNRTTNGANNGLPPKSWTFHDMTSWDSRFYNGRQFSNGVMTAGSAILTSATGANFNSTDIGKIIEVIGAGTSSGGVVGIPLLTTIVSVQSSTQVTLAASATVSVAAAIFRYGFKDAYTEGHYTTYSNGNFEMNYRLLFPANYNENENYKYPMIVFVHGAGERGNCWGGNCFINDNTISRSDGSVTTGSNILNIAGAAFTTNDVNKAIRINFGPSNGNVDTRITAVNSATQVVLATNSSVTSATRSFTYGFGSGNQFRNNDLSMVHGGQTHLEAVHNPTTGSNGKKAEDPTLHSRAFPGFVFIPQNLDGWGTSGGQAEQVFRLIELLIQNYDIDPDRIYMHGLSNGGDGTWQILRARPDLFAAILPMSATPTGPGAEIFNAEISKAVPIPTWIFQGGVDTAPTPNNTNQVVAKLRNAGGTPRYKIYPTVGHGTWGNAYNEPDFFSWMLKQNKRNVNILYGDSTLCGTNNNGVKLALSVGFLAYQWELDGSVISGATSNQYTATQPGTYRARFSRISATPSEAQWNAWSSPVVIRQSPAVVPVITATGTSRLPDINGGNSVTITTPVNSLTKNWFRDNTLTTNPNSNPPIDTASTVVRTLAGKITLKTITTDGCSSLDSNPIFVTLATPVTLAAPTNLVATVTSPGSALLSWTDNSADETNFELYRSTNVAGPYNFFQLLPQGAVSYTNTGLAPNTTYYYRVRAVNNTAVSAYTPNTSLTTEIDTQAPSIPQNLVVAEKALTSLVLTWTASSDNTGIASYIIESGTGTNIGSTGSSLNEFAVNGLTPNTNYTFRVKAVDLAGNISQPSAQLVTNTTFTGLNYSHTATLVNFLTDGGNNWNDPEETGTRSDFLLSPRIQDTYFNFKFEGYISLPAGTYDFQTISDDGSAIYLGAEGAVGFPFSTTNFATNRIYNNDGVRTNNCRNNDAGNTFPGYSFSGTSFRPITVIMFQQEFSSCLTVQYRTNSPRGGWITIPVANLTSGTAPVLTPPAIPTGLTAASAGMSSINLNWTTVAGAEYEVYRSTHSVNNFNMVARVTVNSFTDTNLNPSTLYYYKLKSVNSNGSSAFSITVNATTAPDTQAPSIPQNVTILSSSYINAGLTWDDCTDNVSVAGYRIYANSVLIGTSVTNSFYTTALQPATLYNFTVSAIDSAPVPNESAQSAGASTTTTAPATFYSKPASDLTQLSSWAINPDGTGASPTNFGFDGQYFTIQNPQTLANPLTIGGNVSRVIVADNVTLHVSQPLSGQLRVGNNATVNVNTNFEPTFETVAANSTVNFNTYTTVPIASYGNLVLNGTGLKNIPAGTVEVKGNLTLGNGVGLQGASLNASTIKVTGNINTGATVAIASSDNRVNYQFTANSTHSINVTSDQNFSRIIGEDNSTIIFNNSSGSAKNLNLGTLNGGGINLANGSTLSMANNHLVLTGRATVNPTNTTGKISINNGNISLTTSATSDANFYFLSGSNQVQTFTLQSESTGITRIREAVDITNAIKINRGVLNANGFVTLKSNATATASIQRIENGSITGNVRVERYMEPKRVYRYIASPVAGVTIANWQAFFPITGTFTGASTGVGLGTSPSLFFYTEPNYIAYPTTNTAATIQVGRGYSAFIREAINPTTLISTGVPTQGNFNFSLTGGTGIPSNGFNLLGNPYACGIVWNNTNWTSNGVGNVIWVRENLVGGGHQWRTWDRSSGTGSLPNGTIPAGQAFWVQTSIASPSLTVTEAAKSTLSASNNSSFFRGENETPTNLFSISINNGTYQDYAYVKLTEDGSDGYDKLKDGFKNRNSFFNISTSSTDGVDLAVNDLQNSFCDKTIAVNLATIDPGTYTLEFNNLDNFSLANLKLVDSFTNTTTTINSGNPQYTLTVTADVSSYQNRLTLQLTRPSIGIDNLVATSKNIYCRSEESLLVEVSNSQAGVEYNVIDTNNKMVSVKIFGNGQTIQLPVFTKDLASNQNVLRVQASFGGCSPLVLTQSKTVSVSESPSLITTTEVSACLGSPYDLTVSGNGNTFEWQHENSGQVLSETGSTLRISVINPINSYRVTAINSNGCKGVPTSILVRADSLEVPSIVMNEGLLKTDATQTIQWLLDGIAIAGATKMEYNPSSTGNYSVKASATFCSRVSAPYLVTAVEDEFNSPFVLNVYPNPSENGFFTLKGNSSSNASLQIHVADLMGKTLANQSASIEEFTSGIVFDQKLASGVYLVTVTQSGKAAYQKIVIR